LQDHETRKAGFLAVKSSFRFLKEIPAYAAEKPGFLPSKAEDTFLPDFWFHEDRTAGEVEWIRRLAIGD